LYQSTKVQHWLTPKTASKHDSEVIPSIFHPHNLSPKHTSETYISISFSILQVGVFQEVPRPDHSSPRNFTTLTPLGGLCKSLTSPLYNFLDYNSTEIRR